MKGEDEWDGLYLYIGSKIKLHRTSAGLSQTQLAKLLKKTRGSVANIEVGRQRAPVHLIYEICEILGANFIDIFPTQSEHKQTKFSILREVIDSGKFRKEDIDDFILKIITKE